MNIYIDESGSINKYATNDQYFVVSMIHVLDPVALERAYKRFISSNYEMLLDLDSDKVDDMTGKITKHGGRMFRDGKFRELKGAQFDRDMKHIFVDYFSRKHHFDVYYIMMKNENLPNRFFDNIYIAVNLIQLLVKGAYIHRATSSVIAPGTASSSSFSATFPAAPFNNRSK